MESSRADQAALGTTTISTKSMLPPSRTENNLSADDGRVESISDDEAEMDVEELMDEDASSLIGVSISKTATRLTSAKTPAVERAAAMDYLEGGGYFVHTDDDTTPPAVPTKVATIDEETDKANTAAQKLSLGSLPSRNPRPDTLPSPWHAGPRTLVVDRSMTGRSILKDTFEPTKRRSSSGSGDNLRKYLPSLPSLQTVGHFLPNLPSLPFTSNNSNSPKSRSRGFSLASSSPPRSPTSRTQSPGPGITNTGSRLKQPPIQADGTSDIETSRPNTLRRVTSDQSLLYHSLSRSSSLGDDSRFENHHEMVNSRLKAIRDSLQDRSTFRLPSMPSMPRSPNFSMPRNWTFNFGNAASMTNRERIDTDLNKGLLPGSTKKRMSVSPSPALSNGAATVTDAAHDAAHPSPEAPSDGNAFERAIANLTGDVVIMGGYRGSVLRSAKPPHRQLWVPVKVGLNIRKVNLEVGLEREDEERMEETIFSSGMLQNIGPVDISRRLFKRLRDTENAKNGSLRIHDYGYDWRLSPDILSRKLVTFLEGLPCNLPPSQAKGALVIAHSLGGLITRHAVNTNPSLFSGVVYAGVPQACVNILGPIRNGDAVLLSSRVLTAQVNFTLRTSFVLLPLEGYCFEDKNTREPYTVDYFNVNDWVKYRFSPCIDPPLPPKNPPAQTGLASILKTSSFTNLQLPSRKNSMISKDAQSSANSNSTRPHNEATSDEQNNGTDQASSAINRAANAVEETITTDRTIAPQMGNLHNPMSSQQSTQTSISTQCTIPRPVALKYLERVLAETKKFKLELAHDAQLAKENLYPPLAVIYGKSVPTVYGARVDGRDGIACADAYDDLAFASGDGVCLAKEAMLPDGYMCVQGGRICSDRGHVTLLGDLNAVGRAIEAVTRGRTKGLGLGVEGLTRRGRGSGDVSAGEDGGGHLQELRDGQREQEEDMIEVHGNGLQESINAAA